MLCKQAKLYGEIRGPCSVQRRLSIREAELRGGGAGESEETTVCLLAQLSEPGADPNAWGSPQSRDQL